MDRHRYPDAEPDEAVSLLTAAVVLTLFDVLTWTGPIGWVATAARVGSGGSPGAG